jgi:hypothetical protein
VKVAVSVFEHDMQGNDLSDLGDYCIVFKISRHQLEI